MKNLFKLLVFAIIAIVCIGGMTSCDNIIDVENPTEKSPIIGKWEVQSNNAKYGSFEFTGDNKYIITQRVTNPNLKSGLRSTTETVYIIVIFGDISSFSENGNTYNLDLKEFGAIAITISGSGATIIVNGEEYTVTKTKEIDNSEKTELLCHTWTNLYTWSYENIVRTDTTTLTFSPAGTYVLHTTNIICDWEPDTDYGTWKWIGSDKLEITATSVTHTSYFDNNGNLVEDTYQTTETRRFINIKLTEHEFTYTIIYYEGGEAFTDTFTR